MYRLLMVSKMVFLHKEGSRGRPRGSRFVWVIMCVWATPGMPKSYLSLTFDQDIDVQSFEIIFSISNSDNDKMNRKPKKICLIFIFYIYFSKNKSYFMGIFKELFCDPKWSNHIFTLKHVA